VFGCLLGLTGPLRGLGVGEDHQPSRKQQLHARHNQEERKWDELKEIFSHLPHPLLVFVGSLMVLILSVVPDCLRSPLYVTSEIFKALNNMANLMLDVEPVVLNLVEEGAE